jgi:hypothetical protein
MVENNPLSPVDRSRAPEIPLLVALYVSGELILELHDGGQPWRRFSIRWERLVPGKKSEPEAAQNSPASLRTRQD